MNKTLRGTSVALLGMTVIGLVLFFWPEDRLPPRPPTATPTLQLADTITPTSTDTFFVASLKIDSPCRFGTSAKFDPITTIPQGRAVMVIGKDGEQAEWLLVRWGGFQDCWIERKFVSSDDLASVAIQPTPSEPTLTPSLTSTPEPTLTITPSPTRTRTIIGPTQTRKPGDKDTPVAFQTNTSNPSLSGTQSAGGTSDPPSNTSKPPTNTSRPPTNTPKPPTKTPVPSPTTDPPHRACNDGVDNDGDSFIDLADSGCSSKGDDSE